MISNEDISTVSSKKSVKVPCLCGINEGATEQNATISITGTKFDTVEVRCDRCRRFTTGPSIDKAMDKWNHNAWHRDNETLKNFKDQMKYGNSFAYFTVLIIGLIIGYIVGKV